MAIDFLKTSGNSKYMEISSIFNTHESYVIITKPEEVNEIS
jgi:hypothetical protein